MFIVILLLSHLVSLDRCGTCLYRFLIVAVLLTFMSSSILFLGAKLFGFNFPKSLKRYMRMLRRHFPGGGGEYVVFLAHYSNFVLNMDALYYQ